MIESMAPEAAEIEFSIPKGGPIYVPNLVGPCTRVVEFENSVVCELQNLEAELCQDTSELCDDDISIDELKVYTEEELMDMALKKAFKSSENSENCPPLVDQSNAGIEDGQIVLNHDHASPNSHETVSDALAKPSNRSSGNSSSKTVTGKKSRRTRRGTNSSSIQGEEGEDGQIVLNHDHASSNSHETVSDALAKPSNRSSGNSSSKTVTRKNSRGRKRGTNSLSIQGEGEGEGEDGQIVLNHDHASSNSHETVSDALAKPSNRSSGNSSSKTVTRKNSRSRKRNILSIHRGIEEKVEEFVKIKQKQEEDKAAVILRSFNPACNITESALISTRTERMKCLRSTSSSKKVNSLSCQEHIPVQYPEVVLTVEVYHNVRKGVKTQELLVLGGQTLTALRDKISCSMDQMMQKAEKHDPSGYFLIESVFYNDLRDPSAVDYSIPILDWLRNSKEEAEKKWERIITGELRQKQKEIMGEASAAPLPRLMSLDMRMIRFCDLRFRLGAGYLYCHQGECTHSIVIRDMRLIHSNDVYNRAAYPITTFQLKLRYQKCSVCKIFRATKVTVDDKWAAENPCYFCNECFNLLHVAEDGSLLYMDFQEFEYNHD